MVFFLTLPKRGFVASTLMPFLFEHVGKL